MKIEPCELSQGLFIKVVNKSCSNYLRIEIFFSFTLVSQSNFMKITRAVEHIFRSIYLTFYYCHFITLITMVLAVVFTRPSGTSSINYITDILRFWECNSEYKLELLSNDAHINSRSCGPQYAGKQGDSEDNTVL